MTSIKPWARGPVELITHAERHLREGGDFDRRIALIGFDNAIEVAITSYLTLNPMQRAGRTYIRADVDKWLDNYHTKLTFLFQEMERRTTECEWDKAEIVWYHEVRNAQYHGGSGTVPEMTDLLAVRKVAIWVTGFLFELDDIEGFIEGRLSEEANSDLPERNEDHDTLIDEAYGEVEIAGQPYATSEALFSIDPVAYSELGRDLEEAAEEPTRSPKEGEWPQHPPLAKQ